MEILSNKCAENQITINKSENETSTTATKRK